MPGLILPSWREVIDRDYRAWDREHVTIDTAGRSVEACVELIRAALPDEPFWSQIARELSPYVPGEQPRIANLVKLNTNESPFGPSPLALEAMRAAAVDTLRLYPDPEAHGAARSARRPSRHRSPNRCSSAMVPTKCSRMHSSRS